MPQLGLEDLKGILSTTRAALACSHTDELRREVLPHVERMFKCNKANFFRACKPYRQLDYQGVISRNIERKFLIDYNEYYRLIDPHRDVLLSPSTVVNTDRIISYQALVRSEYYNDFLEPQGIHYQMNIVLRTSRGLLGLLALFRPRHASNFSFREESKAELLAFYLSAIMEKNIVLDQINRRMASFESIAAALPYQGKIILDESLEPICPDENAHKAISFLEQGKKTREGSHPFLPEEIYRRCGELMEDGAPDETAETSKHRFSLDNGQGQKVPIILRLIKKPKKPPVFVVSLESEDDPLSSLHQGLRELGLTEREREVVSLVYKGLTSREISDRLCISRYTVENHISSIYGKVGVHNRAGLIRRIIAFA